MNPSPLLVFILLSGAVATTLGQGNLSWGNAFGTTTTGLRAPIYGVIPGHSACSQTGNSPTGVPPGTVNYGNAPFLQGTGFTIAIYLGTSANAAQANNSASDTTVFRTGTGAGFVVGPRTITIPFHPVGTSGLHVQFRAWDNRGGTLTSWAAVMADPSGPSGLSEVFTIGALGGMDAFGIVHPTPQTTGIRSFNMHLLGLGPGDMPGCPAPVPEPSTWVLITAAVGFFLILSRRRAHSRQARQ